jgi:hypothetical protein
MEEYESEYPNVKGRRRERKPRAVHHTDMKAGRDKTNHPLRDVHADDEGTGGRATQIGEQ